MMRRILKYAGWTFLGLLFVGVLYGWSLYVNIRSLAAKDDVHAADAIVVLGAAQYNGHPSPVFRARLDHAKQLYDQGYAQKIITTGSYGPDPNFSEAHVGTEFLIQQGVGANSIITEQGSGSTRDSIRASVALMKSKKWKSALVVSDGFHLYRVKRMLEDEGIVTYTSPAPASPIESDASERFWHSLREVALVVAYRVMNL
ncbi:MAG TPA: YdcF family protein [Terriglobia bacterium]|nr:YdcF family protein [Terriglobia bacterium]